MASKGSKPGWIVAEKRRAKIAEQQRDLEALNDIHELLDGKEWDSDTLNNIAEIIRETGREVRDSDGIHERT